MSVQDGNIDQQWYWTEKWQVAEREADEDIKEGRYTTFDYPSDAIKYLKEVSRRDED